MRSFRQLAGRPLRNAQAGSSRANRVTLQAGTVAAQSEVIIQTLLVKRAVNVTVELQFAGTVIATITDSNRGHILVDATVQNIGGNNWIARTSHTPTGGGPIVWQSQELVADVSLDIDVDVQIVAAPAAGDVRFTDINVTTLRD